MELIYLIRLILEIFPLSAFLVQELLQVYDIVQRNKTISLRM